VKNFGIIYFEGTAKDFISAKLKRKERIDTKNTVKDTWSNLMFKKERRTT
jgi:hypothetical protein